MKDMFFIGVGLRMPSQGPNLGEPSDHTILQCLVPTASATWAHLTREKSKELRMLPIEGVHQGKGPDRAYGDLVVQ